MTWPGGWANKIETSRLEFFFGQGIQAIHIVNRLGLQGRYGSGVSSVVEAIDGVLDLA